MASGTVLSHGATAVPTPGQIVHVRTRNHLVEAVATTSGGTTVSLACVDDDNQGSKSEVIWELEFDARILDEESWKSIGDTKKDFDPPRHFAAFFNTVRWNCVTATDPTLFQAPFRAGIQIDPFQLEPLRLALKMPRVNLFIADDVGLGKTIEAGLIARELLLRRRITNIVVAAPPSMLSQWRDELEQRFGLTFEILDREYVRRIREERGFTVNPWETHARFLISQRLLIDDNYRGPLIKWLEANPHGAPTTVAGTRAVDIKPGTLLILDEAHHAAPASSQKYAIDSKITAAVRDIAPRFEHRLFLSATPHNGHSNSFSALLNILDESRFIPGVPVLKGQLDDVLIRRLKEDLRQIGHAFPKREIVQEDITVADDAPEIVLPQLLEQYRAVRRKRFAGASKKKAAESMIVISGLQQRLLSSFEAFATTLAKHREGMERVWAGKAAPIATARAGSLMQEITAAPDADDESRNTRTEDEQLRAEADAFATLSAEISDASADAAVLDSIAKEERALLDKMRDIVEEARFKTDGKSKRLIAWLREHCCSKIGAARSEREDAPWSDTRVIIFTEWDATKRALLDQLRHAIEGTDAAGQRIEVFHGPTSEEERERIKRAFNTPPSEHPVRILICTDAAREGLNLQAHCNHLFHFDVPWNPSRLEQRNGRIDRKLQPKPEVFCHYFFFKQRPTDRVLKVLIDKTKRINAQLGSVGAVLSPKLAKLLETGISGTLQEIATLADELEQDELDPVAQKEIADELESSRKRAADLTAEIDTLKRHLKKSKESLGLDNAALREAVSCSLELLKAKGLSTTKLADGTTAFELPALEASRGGAADWSDTLDTLREPPKDGERDFRWRKSAPIRPVVFEAQSTLDESSVHLHLEHRVVQRLLGRFLAQGFVHHDLSRTCLAASRDEHARVVLLGRLALYGGGAARLHEEIVAVSARWQDPAKRTKLTPEGVEASSETLVWLQQHLNEALATATKHTLPAATRMRLYGCVAEDLTALRETLVKRCTDEAAKAVAMLAKRGEAESKLMLTTLEKTRSRIVKEHARTSEELDGMLMTFSTEARRQFESDRKYWKSWLDNIDDDLQREPERVRRFYEVRSTRIEPLGIVYLIPSNGWTGVDHAKGGR
jgi:superfamily II DNA or RNA helicase